MSDPSITRDLAVIRALFNYGLINISCGPPHAKQLQTSGLKFMHTVTVECLCYPIIVLLFVTQTVSPGDHNGLQFLY